MTEPTLHSLTQRLDRLERERHCWRGASVLLAVIVVALVNLGAATPPARGRPGEIAHHPRPVRPLPHSPGRGR